jgi:DNA-binding FadR family transcriptional regulator
MNSGATAERVYDAVKRRILTGAFRPGERIDVAALTHLLDSSATPVRDALHLLVGETLVETRAGDGFHVPQIDAPTLADRYHWNAQLLLLAIRGAKSQIGSSAAAPGASIDSEPARLVGSLFARIASRTGNAEHMREIEALNDRLHAARMAESAVVSDWREEIAAIADQFEQQELAILRRSITAYHRRRQRLVMEIVRALHHLPTFN